MKYMKQILKFLIMFNLILVVPFLHDCEAKTEEDDILFIKFYIPFEIDKWYQAENQRLLEICKVYNSKCFKEHMEEKSWELGKIYSNPDSSLPSIGKLIVIAKTSDFEWGGLRFGINTVINDRAESWIDDVGDSAYGIYCQVYDTIGDWVLILSAGTSFDIWLNLKKVQGKVYSLKKTLVSFPTMHAKNCSTKKDILLEEDVYFIDKIMNGIVTIRNEIPSDFMENDKLSDPPVADIHFFEIPLKNLYLDNKLIIWPAYTRGM